MNRLDQARVACLAGFSFYLATSPSAYCADAPPASGAVSVVGLLQVIVALGVVLAAIALFAWFLRRWMPGTAAAGGLLRIVGGVMVGPRERLVLVEVGDTWLLVGVAANNVSLVHSMPRPEGAPAPSVPAAHGFARALKQAIAGKRAGS
jgi:flagellar protein FliO/FliZ